MAGHTWTCRPAEAVPQEAALAAGPPCCLTLAAGPSQLLGQQRPSMAATPNGNAALFGGLAPMPRGCLRAWLCDARRWEQMAGGEFVFSLPAAASCSSAAACEPALLAGLPGLGCLPRPSPPRPRPGPGLGLAGLSAWDGLAGRLPAWLLGWPPVRPHSLPSTARLPSSCTPTPEVASHLPCVPPSACRVPLWAQLLHPLTPHPESPNGKPLPLCAPSCTPSPEAARWVCPS